MFNVSLLHGQHGATPSSRAVTGLPVWGAMLMHVPFFHLFLILVRGVRGGQPRVSCVYGFSETLTVMCLMVSADKHRLRGLR